MTAAATIAEFATEVRAADLPPTVAGESRLHLLDALGVGLAASAGADQNAWRAVLSGPGPSTTLWGDTAGGAEAAMLNGALIHSLEYDDTHIGSVVHGSAVAAPLALAAAEEAGADGATMLEAYVIAWEVMVRIGLAAPGAFQSKGAQVTAVAGAIGAAAAAGHAFGLSRQEIVAAIGIAGSQASGLLAFLEDGSSVKALNPGWAAHTGLVAARLARSGMTGPASVLESRFGPLSVFGAGASGLEASLSDLGIRWHLTDAAFKLYPCCHYIHPFLEALGLLVAKGLGPDGLKSLTAHVPVEEAPLIAEPWDRRQAPSTGYDGKWGLPYCLALLLVDGSVEVGSFEVPPRPEVVRLARKMQWSGVENSGFPVRFPARIDVETEDGRFLTSSIETVRGAPGRAVSRDDVIAKFSANARRRLSQARLAAVIDAVAGDGAAPDIGRLVGALRG